MNCFFMAGGENEITTTEEVTVVHFTTNQPDTTTKEPQLTTAIKYDITTLSAAEKTTAISITLENTTSMLSTPHALRTTSATEEITTSAGI